MRKNNAVVILLIIILFAPIFILKNVEMNSSASRLNQDIKIQVNSDNTTPPLAWFRIWGGSSMDIAEGIAIDNNNYIYVTGFSNSPGFRTGFFEDMFLLKYDCKGHMLWNKTWNGFYGDYGKDIVIDKYNCIYIAGYKGVIWGNGTTKFQIFVVKYNSAGIHLWNRTWDKLTEYNIGVGITIDNESNIYLNGYYGQFNNYSYCLIKYNQDGDLIWERIWGKSTREYGYGIALDSNNNIYSIASCNTEMILFKFNSSGYQLWNLTWGNSYSNVGYDIDIDKNNNIYLVGHSGGSTYEVYLVKYNPTGNMIWSTTWSGLNPIGSSIYISNESFYITGRTDGGGAYGDVFLLKYDLDGNLIWNEFWGGPYLDEGLDIILDSNCSIYITGYTYSFDLGDYDVFLVKYGLDSGSIGNPIPAFEFVLIFFGFNIVSFLFACFLEHKEILVLVSASIRGP